MAQSPIAARVPYREFAMAIGSWASFYRMGRRTFDSRSLDRARTSCAYGPKRPSRARGAARRSRIAPVAQSTDATSAVHGPADDGGVRILWGADLKRAIEESKSHVKVGQIVAARIVRRERLYLESKQKMSAGAQPIYRNRWEVETPQFVAQRQKFARAVNDSYQSARRSGVDDPESFALYLIHDGARRLAEERFANVEDQQKFLARVRNFFAASPEREALIAKTVERLKQQEAATHINRAALQAREGPTRE